MRLPLPSAYGGWTVELACVGAFGPWTEEAGSGGLEGELLRRSSLCLEVESPPRGPGGRVFLLRALWSADLGWSSPREGLPGLGSLMGALAAEVDQAGPALRPPPGLALAVARAVPSEEVLLALSVMES